MIERSEIPKRSGGILKFWLLDLWSRVENGVETAHLYGFDADGNEVELVDDSIRPFLLADDCLQGLGVTRKLVRKRRGLDTIDCYKITGYDATKDIPAIKKELEENEIETAESDIYYTQVYMKERGFKPCSWHLISNAKRMYPPEDNSGPRTYWISESKVNVVEDDAIPKMIKSSLDIETLNPGGGMPDVEEDPICLFGYKSETSGEHLVELSDAEEDDSNVITTVAHGITHEKPHIIGTYNGNQFDWGYIADRGEKTNSPFRIAIDGSVPHKTEWNTIAVIGRPTIDLYGLAKFVIPKGTRKSQYHVHKELVKSGMVPKRKYYGVDRSGKDLTGIDTNRIAEYWKTEEGREKVRKHCKSDIIVTHDLLTYAIPFAVELSRLTNIPIDQVLSVPFTVLIEGFLMQFAHKRNEVIPNAEYHEVPETSGAVCFEPVKGLLIKITVFDFKSMYPIILVEYNIGPETFAEVISGDESQFNVIEDESGRKFYFLKEPKSLFAEAMEYLLKRIDEAKIKYKDKKYKQKYAGEVQALKTVARAMYGYMKAKKSRWFSPPAMEAVAVEGRNRVRRAREVAAKEEYGYETVAGDTDSIFLDGIEEDEVEEFAKVLSEDLDADIGFDKFYKTLFFTGAKKMYAGLQPDGEIDFVGFIKGDWAPISNRAQSRILETILKERDVEKAKEIVFNMAEGIRHGVYPLKDFIIWKKLRKGDPEAYENKTAHSEVAKRNPEVFIEEDGTIGYVVVKGPGKIWQKARHYSEVKGVPELDRSYYIKKQLLAVSNRILSYFLGEEDMINKYFEM